MAESKGDDSDDSLVEVTPYDIILKIEDKKKKAAQNLPPDTVLHLLQVSNLPRNCTAKMIVEFFGSHHVTKSVPVYLGEDGVIIQHLANTTYAFVLFQSFDRLNLGILKDGQTLGDKKINAKVITLFEAMIIGCNLRRKFDFMKDFERYIFMRYIPGSLDKLDIEAVIHFLRPYDKWLDTPIAGIDISVCSSSRIVAYRVTSELAAFFIHMKKNWSPLVVNEGIEEYIQVSMASCTTTFSTEGNFPPLRRHTSRPLHCGNFVKRDKRTFTILICLSNLPAETTETDVSSIFQGRVQVSPRNISLAPESAETVSASILFSSFEEGIFAVRGTKFILFKEHLVNVNFMCIQDM